MKTHGRPHPFGRAFGRALGLATSLALALTLPACGGGEASEPAFAASGKQVSAGSGTPGPAAGTVAGAAIGAVGDGTGGDGGTAHLAAIVALPLPEVELGVNGLSDRGRAGGQLGAPDGTGSPFTVSAKSGAFADAANFFTGEASGAWTVQVAGINVEGVLAGGARVGERSFGWTWNGEAIRKFEPPEGFAVNNVAGPADDGRVALTLFREGEPLRAVLMDACGTRTDIPTLVPRLANGSRPSQLALAMSGNGTVMGLTQRDPTRFPHIFTFVAGSLRDFGTTDDCRCTPVTVSNEGWVLANPLVSGPGFTGLLLNGAQRVAVNPPPGGTFESTVNDGNDRNDVVGSYRVPAGLGGGPARPFVMLGEQSFDLNDYTHAARLGWTLLTAVAVNNQRQIVGLGMFEGRRRWYRLALK